MNTSIFNYPIRLTAIATAIASLAFLGCSSESHEHASSEPKHEDEHAHEDAHAHDDDSEKKEGGPNGGRIITSVNPRFEFLINDDRTLQLTFLDDESRSIAPNEQIITLIGGDRANPTRIAFVPKGKSLVSSQALPEGGSVPVVLQIKTDPKASIIREKFNVNLSECPTCDYQEYACVCGHDD